MELRKIIYFASPLGFSEVTRPFLQKIVSELSGLGHMVLNPWELTSEEEVAAAMSVSETIKKETLQKLNIIIGQRNREAIDKCDAVFAVLDGAEIDSGTASEIGYAAGRGKPVLGYRNDFRLCGDNEAAVVNIQVEYFIKMYGGTIIRSMDELKTGLENLLYSK